MPQVKQKPESGAVQSLTSNRRWVQDEISKLRNGTVVLVVVTFATLGVLIGYYLFSGAFGNPFKNVTYAAVNGSSVQIAWETSFPARTRVEYGTSDIYLNETQLTPTFEVSHDVDLDGLLPDRSHLFRLVAEGDTGQKYISVFYKIE
jgi:hypothetical protein